jgi:predicted nucleic acid-binding Zn ribbon protein
LVIEALLQDGQVPGDGGCACCGAAVAELRHVKVECERVENQEKRRNNPFSLVLHALFGGLLGGMIALLFPGTERQERGRNVAYRLPVRVCQGCGQEQSRSVAGAALRAVDEYRRLLDKYPHAWIGKLE